MGLEAPSFINDFITANPEQTDFRYEGDDHLRNMKTAIVATFPNIDGEVAATPTELNLMVGLTALPELAVEDLTLAFASALAAGASRTFTETAAGITTADTLLPMPGQPWSSYPGLLITSWRPLTDEIEVVVFNAGASEVPISTSLALPVAVLT